MRKNNDLLMNGKNCKQSCLSLNASYRNNHESEIITAQAAALDQLTNNFHHRDKTVKPSVVWRQIGPLENKHNLLKSQ